MKSTRPASQFWLPTLLMTLALSACGGAGTSSSTSTPDVSIPNTNLPLTQEPGAPIFQGNTASDGLNWFNFRRQQSGLPALTRNTRMDAAAQAHSEYQRLNNTITHNQTAGLPGFTGVDLLARLNQAGYTFDPRFAHAYGEVISSTSDASGFYMAEELVAAIYHRFVIFEPTFKETGGGAAYSNGNYYFTTDFAANNGYGPGLTAGNVATYPFANQERVPVVFNSDYESPDPVAGQNEVGYPISVHANIDAVLTVQNFSVKARNGSPLPVKLLVNQSDHETPRSAAAIVPLVVLSGNTIYDVDFSGTLNGVAIQRSWSFRTR